VNKPLIQDYENYRDYLRDWYAWMKESSPQFSYRTFSKWAGFKSPNQLQLIIQGKRNITRQTLGLFTKILKLKRREARYFEILVNLNQASTPQAQANYLKDLSEYFKRHGNELKHNQYEYLMKWYYPVLRELVTTKGFKIERHALARRIGHGITPRQIDEALDKLIALKLLAKNEGKLKQSQAVVTTGAETKEAASYFYHEQMLQLALAALKKQMPDERNFSAITLACRKSDISEIAQILNDCRQQVLSYLENRDGCEDEEVYQLNLQLFRVTKKR